MREACALAKLKHPNVVAVHETGLHEGYTYMVMDYVEGEGGRPLSLADLLAEKDRLPEVKARSIALDIARALEYAHAEGVLHRDISPSNVLVSREGEVKLADFGLADAVGKLSTTGPGSIGGKAGYLSPERLEGKRPVTGDDLFDLNRFRHKRPPTRKIFYQIAKLVYSGLLKYLRANRPNTTYMLYLGIQV